MFMSRLKQGYLNVLVKSLIINCESFPCQQRVCVEYFTAGHTQAHTPWQTSTPSHTSLMFCSKYLQTLPGSQIVSWKQDVIYTSFWFHFISHYIEVPWEGKKWWSQFVWWWSSIRGKKNFKSSLEYTSGQSLISSGLQSQYNHVAQINAQNSKYLIDSINKMCLHPVDLHYSFPLGLLSCVDLKWPHSNCFCTFSVYFCCCRLRYPQIRSYGQTLSEAINILK